MSVILLFARGQYRVLYALLAGCGPLRAGEALGLEIDKQISGVAGLKPTPLGL